jgi:hypothetical protein
MRSIAAGLLVAGMVGAGLVGLSGAAFADGGCPSGGDWFLAPTGFAIDSLDNGSVQDQNGDGLACFKVNKGQSDKHQALSFTWKDNTN